MDLIVGGGKFGCYAIEHLKTQNRAFTVIDTDPNCQAATRFHLELTQTPTQTGEHLVHGNLQTVLQLIDALNPEYIYPTAPTHIAADLTKLKYNLQPWPQAIDTILPRIPPAIILHTGHGNLILSYNRDYQCNEKCPMPQTCPTSGTKKPCTMTNLMTYAAPNATILISYSMAPGIGAIKTTELSALFQQAQTQNTLLIGTACDCHGVFTALQKP